MTTTTASTTAAPDWNAAQNAVENGNIDTVRAYLDAGGDVDKRGGSGNMTLLMWAGFSRDDDIAALLIERGADVNVIDSNCRGTALMWAVEAGATEVVRRVLEKNPVIDHKDSEGETALMYAAHRGDRQIVKMLLEKGADPTLTSRDGKTAMDRTKVPEGSTVTQGLSALDVAKVIQQFIDKRADEKRKLDEAREAVLQLTADTVSACRNGASQPVTLSRKLVLKAPISAG